MNEEEYQRELQESSPRIEMAIAVEAPVAAAASTPRPVDLKKMKKRVPAPKVTKDDMVNGASSYSQDSNNNKNDQFAALLALGVQHQQHQLNAQSSSTSNNNATRHRPIRTGSNTSTNNSISSPLLFATRDTSYSMDSSSATATVADKSTVEQENNGSNNSIERPPFYANHSYSSSTSSLFKLQQHVPSTSSPLSGWNNSSSDCNSGAGAAASTSLHAAAPSIATRRPGPGIMVGDMQSTSRSASSSSTLTAHSYATSSQMQHHSSNGSNSSHSHNNNNTSKKMASLAAKFTSNASSSFHKLQNTLAKGSSNGPSDSFQHKEPAKPFYTFDDPPPPSSSYATTTAHGLGLGIGRPPLGGIAESPSASTTGSNGQYKRPASPAPSMSMKNDTPLHSPSLSLTPSTVTATTASTNNTSSWRNKDNKSSSFFDAVNRFRPSNHNGGGNMAQRRDRNASSSSSNSQQGHDSGISSPQGSGTGDFEAFQRQQQQERGNDSSGMTKSTSFRSISSKFNSAVQSVTSNLPNSSSSSSSNLRNFSFSGGRSSSPSNNDSTPLDTTSSSSSSSLLASANTSSTTNPIHKLGMHRATPSTFSLSYKSSRSNISQAELGSSGIGTGTGHGASNSTSYNSSSSASHSSGAGHGNGFRRNSVRSRKILGVNVPNGRAGEVFGAPLHVAADRTRLVPLLKGQNDDREVPQLPGGIQLDEESMERRKEACMFLPAIAIRCLDYLNEYGKTEEGLYRIPGSTQQISNLKTIFDAGADLDLLSRLSTRDLEPSAVASCFKLWLRELPESLLHNMEREIDILLLEHTGNAASSKVTMAQAQSPAATPPSGSSTHTDFAQLQQQQQPQMFPLQHQLQQQRQGQGVVTPASPLVIARIRDLFANSLPKENVILLREIAYHLAHLASFSNITKMTFANLRLILSPTLRLSPVMLSLLVNEREQVFPKAGQFAALAQQTGMINFSNPGALDLSLAASTGGQGANQPQLTLSLPGEMAGLPPVPPSKSPIIKYGGSSSTPPSVGLRVPLTTLDTNWSSLSSSTSSAASPASAGTRRSNGSIPGYRASWHVVDLPSNSFMDDANTSGGSKISGSGTQKNSMDGADNSDEGHSSTPIARKFLHQRASIGSLLERSIVLPGQSSPSPSASSRRSVSSGASIQNGGSGVLTRTPTLTGRSPSPFFSSGAPPAALGFIATHSRKRSSASSFSSIISNSAGGLNSASAISENGRAPWKPRKPSPAQHENVRQVMKQQQDEEEELSNSDTNTSVCSSTSSAQTPKDQDDIDQVISSSGNLSIGEKTDLDDEENDTVDTTLDNRRATITVDSFNSATFARKGNGRYANNDEMKRKRGSVMLMNMPSFS